MIEHDPLCASPLIPSAIISTQLAPGAAVDQLHFALDPTGWAHATLRRYQDEFAAGNQAALPLAIKLCGLMGMPLQPWMVSVWSDACNAVFSARVASWDDVLRNRKDRIKSLTKLAKAQRKVALYERITSLLQKEPPTSINRDFFDDVAGKLLITFSQAVKLFYEIDSRYRPRSKQRRHRGSFQNAASNKK